MKKVLLSLAVIGLISFTSCKKTVEAAADETTENVGAAADAVVDGADATGDAVVDGADAVVDGATELATGLPQFESEAAQTFASEYSTFYKEMTEAAKSGNTEKLTELSAKAQEWATKMQEVAKDLTPEDQKKLSDWAMELAKSAQGQ